MSQITSIGPTELWPWLALAGLGFFHGVNPAMGWLFAVALGLHRHSRATVLLSLVPIAAGHAAAIALVLAAALALGLVVDHAIAVRAAAAVLIGWALWHAVRGHRQRVHVGMQTGFIGLAAWSCMMATAHGAGLMTIPVLMPICSSGAAAQAVTAASAVPIGVAALAVHTGAMLATIGLVSIAVYEWVGLEVLRSHWINFDHIWIAALALSGVVLLFV
jgi:hypothetical protein